MADNDTLEFVGMDGPVFERNLKMIDSQMPLIIAEMIKAYYLGEGKPLKN